MSFRINTNVSSLQAQRSTGLVVREAEASSRKLSSGERITQAADDAAGLAISEKLKSDIRSSRQANRNANDGLSMVQVAEGGLNESSSILARMRELAVQASTDTLSDSDRLITNMEYQQMKQELERIAQTTEFNGRKLLTGQGPRLDFQVGVGDHSSDDQISMQTSAFNATAAGLGLGHVSVHSKSQAQASLQILDRAIDKVTSNRSLLGSIQNRLISSSNNLGVYTENMSAANSRIRDLDYAVESAQQARNTVVSSASVAVLAQANTSGQNALKLV
jgi:flagellin